MAFNRAILLVKYDSQTIFYSNDLRFYLVLGSLVDSSY